MHIAWRVFSGSILKKTYAAKQKTQVTFLDFDKVENVKVITCRISETIRSVFPVSIILLKPYTILYNISTSIICFGVHSAS